MTYADTAALASDYEFLRRLTACCSEQAAIFADDPRPEYASLAIAIVADAGRSAWFNWTVAASPGFGADSASVSDAQLLSAVQTNWPKISAAHPEVSSA